MPYFASKFECEAVLQEAVLDSQPSQQQNPRGALREAVIVQP